MSTKITKPKWVKEAAQFCVTVTDGSGKDKKQTQSWFNTLSEAETFIKEYGK